jgi:hypothetical protein
VKDDPFSALGGLDQQLFKDQDNATTKQRDNATAEKPGNEPAREDSNDRESGPTIEQAKPPGKARPKTPQFVLTPQRLLEAKRTRVSARTGHLNAVRAVERHSHDIYVDQIRWMNRVKLDILETYGAKVTNNEMVQLAVDLFRADFERNGDDSSLMRVLVMGQEPDLEGGVD